MQVVYSPPTSRTTSPTETYMGVWCRPTRSPNGREHPAALVADGGFELTGPTEHGEDPITAVHDPGLVRFLEVAWSEVARQGIPRPSCRPTRTPTARCSRDERRGHRALRPRAAQSAGGPGSGARLGRAAGRRDVRRRAGRGRRRADDGRPRARRGSGRVRPVPAARSPRRPRDVRRLLLLQQRGDRGPGHHPATGERVAILDVDYHHGNGTQQIFWRRGDVRYVSIHADPDRQYPYFLGRADETGRGRGRGENLNIPLRAGDDERRLPRGARPGGRGHRGERRVVVVVSLGFDTYGLDPIGDFALTTDVYHEVGRRVAALGRRLVILQEGGYHRPSLGENARAWLRGAEGRDVRPRPSAGFGRRRTAVAGSTRAGRPRGWPPGAPSSLDRRRRTARAACGPGSGGRPTPRRCATSSGR